MSSLDEKYILFIRHGSVARETGDLDKDQGLNTDGIETAYITASMLGEELELKGIDQIKIWCSQYKHAREHAGAVKKTLEDRDISVYGETKLKLNPSVFRPWNNNDVEKFVNDILKELKSNNSNALILVGHQPQLGWLCEHIHGPIAIARSEIVCIGFEKRSLLGISKRIRSRLLWSIAPTDNETFDLLRDKIKSKMDTARLLGTFIVFLLGIILGILSDSDKLDFLTSSFYDTRSFIGGLSGIAISLRNDIYLFTIIASVILLFLAVIFYLIAMYAYDRLLMPTRFWSEGIKTSKPKWLPSRPPSSSLLILQVNMMRIWRLLFTPATVFVVLSLIGFALVVMRADPLEYIFVVLLMGLVIYLYYRFARPRLGAED